MRISIAEWNRKASVRKRNALAKLLEDGTVDPAATIDPAPDATQPDITSGVKQAAHALLDQIFDGTLDAKAALAKIARVLDLHDELVPSQADAAEARRLKGMSSKDFLKEAKKAR